MKINSIYLDGFGHFHQHAIGGIDGPITVLYGPNEAGKSTRSHSWRSSEQFCSVSHLDTTVITRPLPVVVTAAALRYRPIRVLLMLSRDMQAGVGA